MIEPNDREFAIAMDVMRECLAKHTFGVPEMAEMLAAYRKELEAAWMDAPENLPSLLAEQNRFMKRRAAELALKWTKQVPMVAGWYWYRTSGRDAITVERVIETSGGGLMVDGWIRGDDRDEWAGPIAEPEE
jgi:hypothetical protein